VPRPAVSLFAAGRGEYRESIGLWDDRPGPCRPPRRCAHGTETDWVQIVEWYDELLRITDSPVARLNRAVAVGKADGPGAA
jgi:hypothetical protein